MSTLLVLTGLLLLVVGGFRYGGATDHLKPEYRDWRGATLYWRPDRFTEAGWRIVTHAFRFQLAGLALIILGLALD